MKRFMKKRNNKGVVWAALLGLGVSVAAVFATKNGTKNKSIPVQKILENIKSRTSNSLPNMTNAIAEMSKELAPAQQQRKE